MNTKRLGRCAPLLLVLLSLFGDRAGAQSYTLTDLGTLDGATTATALNNRGQVAGTSVDRLGRPRAFRWTGGRMEDLGAFSGGISRAFGINDRGQVVGDSLVAFDDPFPPIQGKTYAFRWTEGRMELLGAGEGDFHTAYGIHDSGTSVGTGTGATEQLFPVVWPPSAPPRVLPTTPPLAFVDAQAFAISPTGLIAGYTFSRRDLRTFATLWQDTTNTNLPALANGEGSRSEARAVNGQGVVVGVSTDALRVPRPVMWMGARVRLLADVEGVAYGINEHGQIVGAVRPAGRAVLFEGGRAVDLNTRIPAGLGWVLQTASDINDRGQIAGTGTLDGRTRGFLLTPASGRYRPPGTAGWSR